MFSKNRTLAALAIASVGAGVYIWALWHQRKRKGKGLEEFRIGEKTVRIINSSEEWEAVDKILQQQLASQRVLGLDCEWVLKNKVALLQLATPQGFCVLVRLFKMTQPLPQSLKVLLADKSILKVGVAVMDDGKKLHQDYGLRVNGCVDLRHMLKRIRGVFYCKSRGLRGLAEGVLNVSISKDFHIRCGNWEAETYSQKQIDYAATDAAVAVDIFLQLVFAKLQMSRQKPSLQQEVGQAPNTSVSSEKRSGELHGKMDDSKGFEDSLLTITSSEVGNIGCDFEAEQNPVAVGSCDSMFVPKDSTVNVDLSQLCQIESELNTELENNLPSLPDILSSPKGSEIFWRTAKVMCQGIVDVGFIFNTKNGGMPLLKKQPVPQKETKDAHSTRRRPLWDNCRLEAPDGKVLCTCDTRKAHWYLDKALGEKVCDDPLTVRLLFEPSNRPHSERNYYLQEKENICVVCGFDKDYVRKFVIPFEYRKYFPGALKDHSSHDVLLLCTTCHRRSCDFDSNLRQQLAEECNAPLESGASSKTVLHHDLQKVRSAGRALKLNKSSIPPQRVKELEKVLLDFFGVQDLNDDLIHEASDIDARQTADDYVPHGKRVVRHMAMNGGLLAFQTRWRQHFLDTMSPQHLPTFWTVDFVPEGWTQQLA